MDARVVKNHVPYNELLFAVVRTKTIKSFIELKNIRDNVFRLRFTLNYHTLNKIRYQFWMINCIVFSPFYQL